MTNNFGLSCFTWTNRARLLATCSVASLALAAPAFAAPVENPSLTATGQISLGNPLSLFGLYQDGPRASPVDIIPYTQDGDGNHGFIHTYGSAEGFFGARSSGAGDYEVISSFSFRGEMHGTANAAAFLSFTITDGEVLATAGFSNTNANARAHSRLTIDIISSGDADADGNGKAASFSAEQTTTTAGGSAKATTNEQIDLQLTPVDDQQYWDSGLGFPGLADGYTWGAQSFTVSLGTFDASGFLSFEYLMTAVSDGDRGDTPNTETHFANIFDSGYGGDYGYGQCREQPIEGDGGPGETAAAFTLFAFEGGSSCQGPFQVVYTENSFGIARSGDPFNGHLPGLDANALTFAPTSVPEPGTIAVIGAGLAGLLLARRRRAAVPEDAGF